ncbi:MAG: 16S rRNA (adenine(1518)-N(6)/adenine(1519)-N(6))-dimethyltransferase RsmA [Fibrobacterota bacterium]
MAGHIPNKRFGQNFLTVEYYIERIVNAVPAQPGEQIVEIGPGKGALTRHLLKKENPLLLVERDRDLAPYLEELTAGRKNAEIAWGDGAKYDYHSLREPWHAVGNLPYNAAAMIIKAILFAPERLKSLTCMVQKEVAQRICAQPGNKTIGFSTILCSYFGQPTTLFDVPPGAFFPKPKVTSAVFQICPDPDRYTRLPRAQWPDFFRFVSAGYNMRRKKLVNTIGSYFSSKDELREHMAACGLDPSVRAESLRADQWVELYKRR